MPRYTVLAKGLNVKLGFVWNRAHRRTIEDAAFNSQVRINATHTLSKYPPAVERNIMLSAIYQHATRKPESAFCKCLPWYINSIGTSHRCAKV